MVWFDCRRCKRKFEGLLIPLPKVPDQDHKQPEKIARLHQH